MPSKAPISTANLQHKTKWLAQPKLWGQRTINMQIVRIRHADHDKSKMVKVSVKITKKMAVTCDRSKPVNNKPPLKFRQKIAFTLEANTGKQKRNIKSSWT